jgi:succinyl-diaminopimelate desuccinylase
MTLDLRQGLVELTMAICDLPSVSGEERALADAIEAALRAESHLEVTRNGDAIVARTNFGCEQRVIIAGHIDTVPIAENLPSQLMHFEREQVIWGRGSVDMKGGVAVILALAAQTTSAQYDINWVFYDHEEVDSSLNGLGRIAREQPELLAGSFAVLCEPTSAQLEGGCNGTLRAELTATGVKAHSARPWMGKNAIHGLSPALVALAQYQPESIEVDGLVYRESLSAVGVAGGIAGNVIPDSAKLTVNYRFAPSRSVAEASELVRELFAEYQVEIVDSAAGARPGLETEFAQSFMTATGIAARPKYGWTDVARFTELEIPAVNYGPGDPSLAHADNENLPVGHLFDVFEGLRSWLNAEVSKSTAAPAG